MNDQLTLPIETPQDPSIPPKRIERNEFGLIKNYPYVYDEGGMINWRAMLKPEFLVPNKQLFEKRGRPIPESIEGLKDNEILILLGGLKDLCAKRGFSKVKHTATSPSPDYVVSICEITWIPSFESEGREVTFSAIGDASLKNTNGFGSNYLGPIAENRAFVRAVRNFLRINVCAADEVSPNVVEEYPVENLPSDILSKTMKENNITFDQLKIKLIEEKFDGAENLTCVNDIAKFKQFEIIGRIKSKAEKK